MMTEIDETEKLKAKMEALREKRKKLKKKMKLIENF